MRSRLAASILVAGFTIAGWSQTNPLRSPEIAPDRKVTFRLLAPKATEVTIAGEFMTGSKPLEKNAQGLWSITVGPIDPEVYNYNLTIDGVRTIDPNNPRVKFGSTPSTIASILHVPGDQPAFYEAQPVPHGEIRTHWYDSKSLKTLRRLTVYTPPGYDRNTRARYPVLYLFHGANADETAWTRLGNVNLILDNLIASGKTKPMLVVMPFGYGITPGATAPTGVSGSNTALFARDLTEDVIPFIDSHYRSFGDRERRAIAGLSMGGGESLEIGTGRLDLFSYVAGFSSAIRTQELRQTYGSFAAGAKTANQKLKLLWIGCGKQDSLFAANENFSKFLDEAGIKHVFRQTEGAHTWMVWRRYLNELAPLLF